MSEGYRTRCLLIAFLNYWRLHRVCIDWVICGCPPLIREQCFVSDKTYDLLCSVAEGEPAVGIFEELIKLLSNFFVVRVPTILHLVVGTCGALRECFLLLNNRLLLTSLVSWCWITLLLWYVSLRGITWFWEKADSRTLILHFNYLGILLENFWSLTVHPVLIIRIFGALLIISIRYGAADLFEHLLRRRLTVGETACLAAAPWWFASRSVFITHATLREESQRTAFEACEGIQKVPLLLFGPLSNKLWRSTHHMLIDINYI